MRIPAAIAMLLVSAAFLAPTASAVGPCAITLTPTSVSPTGTVQGHTLNVRVNYHMDGPGYNNGCDTAWVSGCSLYVDGTQVDAACISDGPGAPNCVPTSCDLHLIGSADVLPGQHTIQATMTMKSGCCNYQSGGTTVSPVTWTVETRDNAVVTPSSVGVAVPLIDAVVAQVGPANLNVPIPVVVGLAYHADKTGGVGTTTYGPVTKIVPTPFGDVPVVLCPSGCPYPTSSIVITLYAEPFVNGQPLGAPISKVVVVEIPPL